MDQVNGDHGAEIYGEPERRIIIHARVQDIPGRIEDRAKVLGASFVQQKYGRPLNWNLRSTIFDAVHIVPPQMSQHAVKAWFIYDLNVRQFKSKTEQSELPHETYKAVHDGTDL